MQKSFGEMGCNTFIVRLNPFFVSLVFSAVLLLPAGLAKRKVVYGWVVVVSFFGLVFGLVCVVYLRG